MIETKIFTILSNIEHLNDIHIEKQKHPKDKE